MMNFSEALEVLKRGGTVSRAGWNGKGMWLHICDGYTVNLESKFGTLEAGTAQQMLPHIVMYTADKNLVPWLASQTDILATDWTNVLTIN